MVSSIVFVAVPSMTGKLRMIFGTHCATISLRIDVKLDHVQHVIAKQSAQKRQRAVLMNIVNTSL